MSAEVTKMAYVGQVPWHGLGAELTPDADMATWRREAGFEWEARLSDVVFAKDDQGNVLTYKGRKVLFRSDNFEPLSIVSNRYQPVHPVEVLEFFREYVEKLGAFSLETAGCLSGGRKVWALAKTEGEMLSFGEDKIARYLLLATSYDLSLPTLVQQTCIRVVCQNTLGAAVRGDSATQIRIPHKTEFDQKAVKQRMMLDENWKAFSEVITRLTQKVMAKDAAAEFFKNVLFPLNVRENPALYSEAAAQRKVDQVLDIWEKAPGQEMSSAKDTAWGALNAITFYVDHIARARTDNARLERAWFGEGAAIKDRALQTLAAV